MKVFLSPRALSVKLPSDFILKTTRRLHKTPTATMSSGDESSELSSVPSDVENDLQLTKKDGILKFFSMAPRPGASVPVVEVPAPARKQRAPSPPHEYVLADNPDIAVRICIHRRVLHGFTRSKRVDVSCNGC
tara:strand:- start:454 stop:852 length:399 start_codon:yes stop_codon:yes gene_type:complete